MPLDNLRKIILVEIKAGIIISTEGWTQFSSSGGTTGIYWINYSGPELVNVEENKTDLIRAFSISECKDNKRSYYHDIQNQVLFLQTINAEDPATSGLYFVGYTWLCFTNSQEQEHTIDFIPQNATEPVYYKPLLDASSIPSLTQRVSEYYTSAVSIQFGALSFLNDTWWWENRETYLWHNKDVFVKLGERDFRYDEFVTIFPGRTRKPSFSDDKIIINVKDRRISDLKQIPEDRFDTTTYPNLDPDYENKVIPILFGTKTNLTPPSIDTVNWIYKISQTSFNGTAYSINDINEVYKDGIALVEGVDWNSDDANGQFTLLADPGTSDITCDAEGIQCQYDFATGLPTGNFTENTADVLFFILTELNNISINDINLSSFSDLQTRRTQRIGWWLNEATHTNEFLRILQAIAFHLIPTLDGHYIVQYYDRAIPDDTKSFRTDDYFSFNLLEDTDSAYKFVVLRYDYDHTLEEWKEEVDSENETEYKHNEKNTLTIETALIDQGEAQSFLSFYLEIVKDPGNKIKIQIGADAFDNIPSDKAYFSRYIFNDKQERITILDEEVYTILELIKSAETGKTDVLGLLDTQAGGIIVHTDVPHGDEHTDAHIDELHTDTHSDSHSDSHGDSYNDVPHTDDYTDIPHADGYRDHTDGPHQDGYDDVPHDDSHSDSHTDNHTDTPHSDSHGDSHGDGHADEYTDEHMDTPHVDSEI